MSIVQPPMLRSMGEHQAETDFEQNMGDPMSVEQVAVEVCCIDVLTQCSKGSADGSLISKRCRNHHLAVIAAVSVPCVVNLFSLGSVRQNRLTLSHTDMRSSQNHHHRNGQLMQMRRRTGPTSDMIREPLWTTPSLSLFLSSTQDASTVGSDPHHASNWVSP